VSTDVKVLTTQTHYVMPTQWVGVGVQTQTAHRHNTSCINSLLVATIYGATSFSMAIELRNDNSSWYSADYNNKIT